MTAQAKVNLQTLGIVLAIAGGIASPFIAIGGYKEKIANITKTQEAHATEIAQIKTSATASDLKMESRLTRIETLLVEIKRAVN